MAAETPNHAYIPALRFHGLTRFFDSLLKSTLREELFKRDLIEQANLAGGQRILDLGCGTGTLAILATQAVPEISVVGLDADAKALSIARRKASDAEANVEFHEALAWDASFPPLTFDRVISTLFFHHLTPENKQRTLAHVYNLLKPGGELHVADWGLPHDPVMRLAFLSVQLLDGFETTADSVEGRLPEHMRQAGFVEVIETHRRRTLFGTLSMYRARRAQK